ncbi:MULTISPECIES: hypothetical protein [unclassified Pseudoalteromonas]|uniref:hypothetical protein n=1 Tax=unclassified Pseudoalteromonas TaxID=194690 RepID=UPI00390CC4BA|nr:hypothetical protein [Ningiella sp. W23]
MAKPRHPTLGKHPTLVNTQTSNTTRHKAKPAPVMINIQHRRMTPSNYPTSSDDASGLSNLR